MACFFQAVCQNQKFHHAVFYETRGGGAAAIAPYGMPSLSFPGACSTAVSMSQGAWETGFSRMPGSILTFGTTLVVSSTAVPLMQQTSVCAAELHYLFLSLQPLHTLKICFRKLEKTLKQNFLFFILLGIGQREKRKEKSKCMSGLIAKIPKTLHKT